MNNFILLNGLPSLLGATLLQVTFINFFAIFIEYYIIKTRTQVKSVLLRSIISNLISLALGLFCIFTIPDLLHGKVFNPDDYEMTSYDYFTMYTALVALFILNVIIEIPAYLLFNTKNKLETRKIILTVLWANVISNTPVFLIYGLTAK